MVGYISLYPPQHLANPASAFQVSDAGGIEKSRDRALNIEEVEHAFKVFRAHPQVFTRDNDLACTLLVLLGVRKSELCEAKWEELHLDNATWELPDERSKSGVGLLIPLPDLAGSPVLARRPMLVYDFLDNGFNIFVISHDTF